MNTFVSAIAICCVFGAAQARPGHFDFTSGGGGGGGSDYGSSAPAPAPMNFQLIGVPDESSYSGLTFPEFQIQELGSETEGELPPESIKVSKTITVNVPQPYPVDVPHPVPVPIHVPKPVHIPVTKVIHVPKPVPYEVTKEVPVPIEVPKPYPVPSHESGGGHDFSSLSGGGGGYDVHDQDGGYSNNQNAYQNQGEGEQH